MPIFSGGFASAMFMAAFAVMPVNAAAQNASASAGPAMLNSAFGQVRALSGHDQGEARREMRAGNQLSLREIERRVLPRMQGSEYLGPSYDSRAHAYRLKFIRDGRVTYIDVDARTGRIINRSE